MAICPFAVQKLIKPGSSDPAISPVGLIAHIAVSDAESLFPYFNGPSGGIESHFYIRKDGVIEQYRDTAYEADANYKANSWVTNDGVRVGMLSVETQGYADGIWTAEQISSLKKLIAWAKKTHQKFRPVPATGPFSGGIGYHCQYPEWSPYAKSCPGPKRVVQIKEVIWPWLPTLRMSRLKRRSLDLLNAAISKTKPGARKQALKAIRDKWSTVR